MAKPGKFIMHNPVWTSGEPPDSGEIFRSLFYNAQNGIAYCRMLFRDGRPIDFVYLMVNGAFAEHTGFHDVVGKKITEVMPGLQETDLDPYARVSLTGVSDRFEIYSQPLQKWFQVSVYSPKPEHFIAILENITENKRAEEREQRLTNIYHALSETNEAILKLKSPAELFPSICRIAVEYGGMTHAWIGVPDSDGRFAAVGEYGKFAGPPNSFKLVVPSNPITVLSRPDQPEGRGPSGIAYRENRTVVVNDILGDERLAPWHERAKGDGTNSMAVFPIAKNSHPYGVFSVYSDQVGAFDEEIVSLLGGLVGNLNFALDNLERETLLRESEARFRQLADAMPQLVWTANPGGAVDYYNDRLHEYKTDFMRNEEGIYEWVRIVHPDDVDASVRAWEQAVKVGETYEAEQRVLRADGVYRWHITRAAPIRNGNGRIIKWFGTSTDIHELKSAQEALIEGEERFRALFENAGDGIFIGDMAGQLIDVNASGARMLGYSREEAGKLKVKEILAEHERGRVPDNWDGWGIASNAVSEWTFLRRDGSTFEGEVNAQSLPDQRFMGIVRDVTERKHMLAAIEEKEHLLSLFIENAPAAIAMLDREMQYLAASKRFFEDYHLTGDIIGRSHYEVFPDIPESWREVHRRSLAGETIRMDEDVFFRADGSVEWIRWEIKPWYSGGSIGGILIFSEVITQRIEAEAEKAQLSQQLKLALDAAHMGWWHADLATGMTSYDEQFQEIFGLPDQRPYSKEEFMARVHPEDLQGLLAKLGNATNPAGSNRYESEHRIILPNGSIRWIKSNGLVMFKDEGKARHATSVVGTVVDMTDWKVAEEEKARLSEQRQLALDAAYMGWWRYDPVDEVILFDQRYKEILGLPGHRQTREEILARIHPEDRMHVWEKVEAALNPDDATPYEGEYRYMMTDGSVRWLKAYGMATFEGEGKARHATNLVGIVSDITEQKEAEEQLKLAATVYKDSSEAMMVLDEDRKIIMVNQAFADITGYDPDEVRGQSPGFLRAGPQDDAIYADLWEQVRTTGRFKGEIWHKKKDGQFIAVQNTTNAISGGEQQPTRYVVLLSDITEKKRSDDVIWNQANFDTLTGLPNRRFFRDRLEHEVRNAKRSNLPVALMFLDLDGFKDVNDTLGHDMGDLLLKEAAERLHHCVRESDTVARLGGDEFTIILTEMHDPGNADRVARHILKALSEPIKLGEELAYVSASIGITLYPSDALGVEDLIRNADQAMYAAKQRGKNQYQYFTQSMQQTAVKRMRLVNDMRKALERNQFEIMYQPIVELSTGSIRKAEALIRWRHPRRGLINPVEFISAAEDTGMIASFGNWIFHEAAKQAAIWRDKYHPDFQISVNISPVQFKKEGIDPIVWLEHLKELDLPGQGIVVEITEGLLLDANNKVKEQLLMLRDAGIEVALDDFGTGYSSLAYLKKFDIDYLKIDQAFICNLSANSDDMALCEAIIVMAHKLDLKVIAEGIETDSQHDLLTNAGCDFAQGYLFSKPVAAQDFERLVEQTLSN